MCIRDSNCVVEIDGGEVPIMDGSAAPFVFLLESAGILIQDSPQEAIHIDDVIEVSDGDSWARLEPGTGFSVDVTIDYEHPCFLPGPQRLCIDFSRQSFTQEVSRARTYAFETDLKLMRARGKAKGGNLENALLIGNYGLMNPEGLRFRDEFVRHKILDIIGDLYLLGCPVLGKLVAYKPGHRLNYKLATEVYQRIQAGQPEVQAAESESGGFCAAIFSKNLGYCTHSGAGKSITSFLLQSR